VIRSLISSRSPNEFGEYFHTTLIQFILSNKPTCPYFLHRFLSECLALLFGGSWLWPIIEIFQSVLSETGPQLSSVATEITFLLPIFIQLAPPADSVSCPETSLARRETLSFHQEVVVNYAPGRDFRTNAAAHSRFVLDSLKLQLANSQREVEDLIKQEAGLRLAFGRFRARLHVALPVGSLGPALGLVGAPHGPPTLLEYVSHLLLERSTGSLHGHVIDMILDQICFVLRSYSQAGYDFFSHYLPLPDQSTLYRHHHTEITAVECLLTDWNGADVLMGLCLRVPDEVTPFLTLAIDAISLDCAFLGNRRSTDATPNPVTRLFSTVYPLWTKYHVSPST
jgi:hypothetical protein